MKLMKELPTKTKYNIINFVIFKFFWKSKYTIKL